MFGDFFVARKKPGTDQAFVWAHKKTDRSQKEYGLLCILVALPSFFEYRQPGKISISPTLFPVKKGMAFAVGKRPTQKSDAPRQQNA
jgi:hypothetical protein